MRVSSEPVSCIRRIAEDRLGLAVPRRDPARAVGGHDRRAGRLHDRAEAQLARLQRFQQPAVVQRERGQLENAAARRSSFALKPPGLLASPSRPTALPAMTSGAKSTLSSRECPAGRNARHGPDARSLSTTARPLS